MLPYLTWLIIYVWLPILVLCATNMHIVWKYKKTLAACALASLIVSVPWDIWATQNNAWIFPKTSVIGIYVLGLPIEEYFFISCLTLLVAIIALILRYRFTKQFVNNKVAL